MMKKFGYYFLEPDFHDFENHSMWWEYDKENHRWIDTYGTDLVVGWNEVPIHSVKAAMRHVKKHNEIPVGMKFRLVNAYVGEPDIIITKKARYNR